jgi:hypothetical protein
MVLCSHQRHGGHDIPSAVAHPRPPASARASGRTHPLRNSQVLTHQQSSCCMVPVSACGERLTFGGDAHLAKSSQHDANADAQLRWLVLVKRRHLPVNNDGTSLRVGTDVREFWRHGVACGGSIVVLGRSASCRPGALARIPANAVRVGERRPRYHRPLVARRSVTDRAGQARRHRACGGATRLDAGAVLRQPPTRPPGGTETYGP